MYLGFFGETPVREVIEKDGEFIGLTPEHPEHEDQRFDRAKFTDYVLMYQNLMTLEVFEEIWRKTQIQDPKIDL